jgi:tetratricopeptide (TPR) repeat protein
MVRRFMLCALIVGLVVVLSGERPAVAGGLSMGAIRSSVRLYVSQALAAEKKPEGAAEAKELWDKAIKVGMEGLQQEPDDPELNMYVGKAYCMTGHPKEAGERFKAGLEGFAKKPAKADVKKNLEGERFNCWVTYRNEGGQWFSEGTSHRSANEADSAKISFEKAIESFKHALEIWPDEPNSEVYPPLAFSYIFTNRKDEGRGILQQALAAKPGDSTLVSNLVSVDIDLAQALAESDPTRATALYMEADSLDHSSVKPLFDVATMYLARASKEAKDPAAQKKDYEAAIEYYKKLISRFPDHAYADLAGKELDQEQELYKNALYNTAIAYYQMKEFDHAEDYVRRSLYFDPREKDLYNLHRSCMAQQKKLDAAQQDYLVVQALEKGKRADDPAAHASKAVGDMKAAVTAHGMPSEIYVYTDAETKATIETWFFWKDGVAVTFVAGKKLNESSVPKLPS